MSWSPHDGRFRALVPELKRMPAPTRSRPSAAAGLHPRAARLVLSALGPGSSCSGARPRMVGCAVVDTAVRHLVPDYLEFERAAPQRTALERRSLWRVLYAERHPDAFECYFRIGGEPPDIEAASIGAGPAWSPSECLMRSFAAEPPCLAAPRGPVDRPAHNGTI